MKPAAKVVQSLAQLFKLSIRHSTKCGGLIMLKEGNYQRNHIWTDEQSIRYVEYLIQGGISAREFFFNCSGWDTSNPGPLELVDVISVNDLKTRAEVMQWYVDMNSGGTVHSAEEIDRVRSLIEEATKWIPGRT